LRNCLQGSIGAPELPVWEAALERAKIDPQRRPETLSMPEMAEIMKGL
jgi:16S rRNA A1518/A1519 N6-dimethyltransferase RsmA/KsgA/DIM1 with predicted DNA glycosylase/AP lyase activity